MIDNLHSYDPDTVGRDITTSNSLFDQMSDSEFDQLLQREMPREAAMRRQYGIDRRTFMKLMGGSLALIGFGAACTAEPPDEEIIPYVITPEEIVPGRPLYYASAMPLGGIARGVLIETHEGRPHRIDGNPQHPASLGASNTYMQGSILELYSPDRVTNVIHNRQSSTWEEFVTDLQGTLNRESADLRILTETVTSPSMAAQINTVLERFPNARWHQYEPVNRDEINAGAQLAFDRIVNTVYDFTQANVIVSIDANFVYDMAGSLRYTRDFTNGRKVRGDVEDAVMNRLYMVESTPTITGAMADHRLSLRPSDIENFARQLANELGVDGAGRVGSAAWDNNWFNTMVSELEDNRGSSLIIAGDEQPPLVHALVHAINAALGNVGTTVTYTQPLETNPVIQTEDLAALVDDMGAIDALIIVGGNPVYNAPADIDFAAAIGNVPFSAHLSLYDDETSQLCEWHIPQTYYIEEWGDIRGYDGTLSIIQPPIGPLWDTTYSAHRVLATILEDDRSDYEIVRETWESLYEGDDFDVYWRRTVHNGFAADSAFTAEDVALRADFAEQLGNTDSLGVNNLEVVFRVDPNIYDGRFSNNSWLQELPKPITQIAWDTTVLMSPATAEDLDVENEDLVEITLNGNTMQAPVWLVAGHATGTITVFLGYGTGNGADVEDDRSFNAYDMRSSTTMWQGNGASISKLDETYKIASIRGKIDDFDDFAGGEYTDIPVRRGTLTEYRADPEFLVEKDKEDSLFPDYDYSEGYQWGMTIDLSACIGCNACIIACQSENNIPTVGKENVLKAREMHWLRVDRYYEEEGDELSTFFMPVPCMHCEKAPCELVCPVQATVHDTEGLNNMVYNRCVGTRYCSANCPYSVRRFNFMKYIDDDVIILEEQRNPNVTVRSEGVMEKCTYCVQRISEARIHAKNEDRTIQDGEVLPACAVSCPAQAISFGNLTDPAAEVVSLKALKLNFGLLAELGTVPRTTYLAHLSNPNEALRQEAEEA